jgi:hypothetical protein
MHPLYEDEIENELDQNIHVILNNKAMTYKPKLALNI